MNNSVYAKANSADLADMAQYLDKPVATLTISGNPTWTGASIVVDTANDKITIANHGLALNDRVVLYPLTGDLTKLPGGLRAGIAHYVVGINGDDFQLSLTSSGAAIDITSTGTYAEFQIEKVASAGTTEQTMSISGLNLTSCQVMFYGMMAGMSLGVRLNSISSSSYFGKTDTLGNIIFELYSSTVATYFFSGTREFFNRNNRVHYFSKNGLAIGTTSAAPTTIAYADLRNLGGFTKSNPAFNPITTIAFIASSGFFCNGATLEVYKR